MKKNQIKKTLPREASVIQSKESEHLSLKKIRKLASVEFSNYVKFSTDSICSPLFQHGSRFNSPHPTSRFDILSALQLQHGSNLRFKNCLVNSSCCFIDCPLAGAAALPFRMRILRFKIGSFVLVLLLHSSVTIKLLLLYNNHHSFCFVTNIYL